ncbi:glycosyltransferase family 25 protein [Marinomonas sp. GJ51-6]|uniref:glycosyltransferase family 25 protein n=1 Tax=Marinomonas sp. GJ51-6 TaxID=2992802 RepID=UPI002934EE3C|nr:glycosyltransferase family 25 protein [Marinomonas sp. GJ51-6]WOD06181.1 glycosyltransferase family 25 protein [Marinomonas sp. GJ51-6]
MLDHRIGQVLVVSLPDDTARRGYINKHFSELGISDYQFIDGVSHSSNAVKQYYLSNKVFAYPGCFRCQKNSCKCKNNILIPQQVANWLAFKKVWEKAATHDGLTLVCEDDVLFYPGAMKWLTKALDKVTLSNESPFIIRLAHSGMDATTDLIDIDDVQLSDKVAMSNAAFVLNAEMAKFLINKLDVIETTSDIFIHRWCAGLDEVRSYTTEPLLATDLSFNKEFARFASRIHPKGINKLDEERMNTHIKRVESIEQYQAVLKQWLNSH